MSLGQADLDFRVWWSDKIPFILSPPPNEERIIMCPWIVCLGHVSCTIITVRGFSWRELALKVYWDCPLAIRNSPSQFKGLSGGNNVIWIITQEVAIYICANEITININFKVIAIHIKPQEIAINVNIRAKVLCTS